MNVDYRNAYNLSRRCKRIKELKIPHKLKKSLERHESNKLKATMVISYIIYE